MLRYANRLCSRSFANVRIIKRIIYITATVAVDAIDNQQHVERTDDSIIVGV